MDHNYVDAFPKLPPRSGIRGLSMRQVIDELLNKQACQDCHKMIMPQTHKSCYECWLERAGGIRSNGK